MITSNFMHTNEFFNALFLSLFVINKYSPILYTIPELTINDVEIESRDYGELICPEVRIRIPLTYDATPENLIDEEAFEFHFQKIRDALQEYLNIIVNTNREHLRPLRAPDNTPYNPIFVTAVEASGRFITVGFAYVNTPWSYRLMQSQLKNQHQPDIGLY